MLGWEFTCGVYLECALCLLIIKAVLSRRDNQTYCIYEMLRITKIPDFDLKRGHWVRGRLLSQLAVCSAARLLVMSQQENKKKGCFNHCLTSSLKPLLISHSAFSPVSPLSSVLISCSLSSPLSSIHIAYSLLSSPLL